MDRIDRSRTIVRAVRLALTGTALLTGTGRTPLLAQAPVQGASTSQAAAEPRVHYPASDAARDVAAALAAARKDGRHVLLDFGADWCPDCRVLGALFEDPAVAAVLKRDFHVVRIDVGRRDRNADVVEKYGATSGDWIPALVVLAADGTRLAITDTQVRVTRRTTPAELVALLQQWAPKARVRELAAFVERGVRVTIALDRDRRGGLWLAGTFAPAEADTHVYALSLPDNGIDGLGRPTRLAIRPGAQLRAVGPVIADRPVQLDRIVELGAALPIYPAGAVTLRMPVARTARAASRTDVVVSYMACGARGCLAPVTNRVVTVVVPD